MSPIPTARMLSARRVNTSSVVSSCVMNAQVAEMSNAKQRLRPRACYRKHT